MRGVSHTADFENRPADFATLDQRQGGSDKDRMATSFEDIPCEIRHEICRHYFLDTLSENPFTKIYQLGLMRTS